MAEGGHEPVLIAGAGPVGLAGALELARLGHLVRIVDKAEVRSVHSKAIAVNPRSMDLLELSGALERLMAESIRINRVSMHSGYRCLFTIDLSRLDHPRNYLLSLPQSETEAILEDALAERGVRVERRTELTGFDQDGDVLRATLVRDGQRECVTASHLLGADGAHSTVRHGLGFEFPGGVYPNRWEVADLSLDTPLAKDEVNIFFLPSGGILFVIPLPGE
jgi:2-polyprenyl-6-methoxyphenol hydroxylase-like FAD-dependent oxidoreductase